MNTADLCSCVNIWNCVTPSGVNVWSSSCPQCVNRLAALGGSEGSAAAAKRPDEETLRGGNSPLAGGRRSVWAAQRRLWCRSEGEEGDQSPTEEKHQRWLDNANASCYPACITAESIPEHDERRQSIRFITVDHMIVHSSLIEHFVSVLN